MELKTICDYYGWTFNDLNNNLEEVWINYKGEEIPEPQNKKIISEDNETYYVDENGKRVSKVWKVSKK